MNVIVLGAGVAGLACALMLRRLAIDVVVYEKHAAPDALGAGVVCWPNASFVLRELGLLDALMSVGGRPRTLRRLDNRGVMLDEWDIEKLDTRMGLPSISVLRRDLMRVLMGAVRREGIDIRFGCAAHSIDEHPGTQKLVRLSDGTSVTADLVVGAEGRMDSVARRYVVGNATAVYQGFVNWIGIFESPQVLFGDASIRDYWGTGERFGIVPVSPTRAYWAGAIAMPLGGAQTLQNNVEDLAVIFEDWPSPIPQLLRTVPKGSIRKIYLFDHDPLPSWFRDNVLLVGDAAHASLPTSGQGAAQALEDAWWLYEIIRGFGSDIESIAREFVQARHAKTARITLAARVMAKEIFFDQKPSVPYTGQGPRDIGEGLAHFWGEGLPINRVNSSPNASPAIRARGLAP